MEVLSESDVNYGKSLNSIMCLEGERMRKERLIWMRKTRIRLFRQITRLTCREELDWLMRCHLCTVNTYQKEYWPPMPLSSI